MNGIGRLTQNELIKIFKQTGWKIMTGFVIVIAIAMPLVMNLLYSVSDDVTGYIADYYADAADGTIEKEYYNATVEASQFFSDLGIAADDWRYDVYYDDYCYSVISLKALELVRDGRSTEEVFWVFDSLNVNYTYDDNGNMIDIRYYADGNFDGEGVELTAEVAAEAYTREKADLENYVKAIKEDSISDIAQYNIDSLELELSTLRETLVNLEDKYKTDTSVQYDYQRTKYDIQAVEALIYLFEALKDADETDENWILDTVSLAMDNRYNIVNYAAMDENSFLKDISMTEAYGSYESYSKIMTNGYKKCYGLFETYKYSVDNRIPTPDVAENPVRNFLSLSVSADLSIILFFCLILASTILTSEHSTGTIRLLLIRPRARWKILLSKILAVVIYGAVLFVVASAISMIVLLIVCGSGDLNVPYLTYVDGGVRESTAILAIYLDAIISSFSEIFYISLAFMIAVIAKKQTIAVALPIFLSSVGSSIAMASYSFVLDNPILNFTILPYLDMSGFAVNSVFEEISYSSIGMYGLDAEILGLSAGLGVTVVLIHAAIATVISFLVFRKQQIKS